LENNSGAIDESKKLLERYENQYLISLAQDEQDENYLEEELEEYLEDDWFLGEIEPTNLDSVDILIDLISDSSIAVLSWVRYSNSN
jgi:hypothetical protein